MSQSLDNGPSLDGAKAGRNLSSLFPPRSAKKSSSSPRWRFGKSPPTVAEIEPRAATPKMPRNAEEDDSGRQSSATVDKRQSKMSLFDLFSKPKVERARGFHEPDGESLPERSQTPAHFYRKQDTFVPPSSPAMQRLPSRTSRDRSPSQTGRPVRLEKSPSDGWEPPPLFQAYPQAIKHGTLHGTNIPAETLLRAAQYTRRDGGSTVSLPFVSEDGEGSNASGSVRQKRFSTIADSLEIVEKVFVLTTTGRLVQYTGYGDFDRQPEKILQLNHNSAAFACDLIPGKHWVLEVLQTVDQVGTPAIKQSKSILSRLRVPTVSARRQTASMIIIFSSPEDMDSWLKALRKAIEQLGGKKVEPDPEPIRRGRPADAKPLTKMPSHRYQVQRDPRSPQPLRSPTASRSASVKSAGPTVAHQIEDRSTPPLPSPDFLIMRQSPAASPVIAPVEFSGRTSRANNTRSANPSPPVASIASSDQSRLDQLRDNPRHSFISTRTSRTSETEATTMPTSQGSSTPPTPIKESLTVTDIQRTPPGLLPFTLPTAAINIPRRISSQAQMALPARSSPRRTQRDSVIGPAISPDSSPSTEAKVAAVRSPKQQQRLRLSTTIDKAASRTSTAEGMNTQVFAPIETEDDDSPQRPTSTIGQLPNLSQRSLSRQDSRTEPVRKPFVRPIPVKPPEPINLQARRAPGNSESLRPGSFAPFQPKLSDLHAPRRLSSLNTTNFEDFPMPQRGQPLPLRTSSRARSLSRSKLELDTSVLTIPPSPTSNRRSSITSPSPTTLKRPNSMQVRSDPAPFLSARQPQARPRGYRSASASPGPYTRSSAYSHLYRASLVPAHPGSIGPPPIPPMNANRPGLRVRSSMPTIVVPGLPPPAYPPPNIPLPKVPGHQTVS